jgi:hypothetical protein
MVRAAGQKPKKRFGIAKYVMALEKVVSKTK